MNLEYRHLIDDLEVITNNHPVLDQSTSSWRKGNYGESIGASAIYRCIWSTWNPNHSIVKGWPINIQHGLDYVVTFNGTPLYIEIKNWRTYPNGVSWVSFNSEILDRFKHCPPNSIKVVVMNKYNVTKDFKRFCRWFGIEIIPVSGFVDWYNIYDYDLIETMVDEITLGIKDVYDKHLVPMNNHLPLYESMIDLGKKECALLMKDMNIQYSIIQDVTGYSMNYLYHL